MLRQGASTAARLGFASLPLTPVTIRLARETDIAELDRLAQRDSRPLPDGTLLVAERDGALEAALSLDSGEAIADPFKRTRELVELLRTHAEMRTARRSLSMRRRRLTPQLVGGSL